MKNITIIVMKSSTNNVNNADDKTDAETVVPTKRHFAITPDQTHSLVRISR